MSKDLISKNFNTMFDKLMQNPFFDLEGAGNGYLTNDQGAFKSPKVDIIEKNNCYLVHAEMAGFNEKDVKVTLENGTLEISATHEENNEERNEEKKYHKIERWHGSLQRAIYLGENIDENNIKASFKNGLLDINIPKLNSKESGKKQIKVN